MGKANTFAILFMNDDFLNVLVRNLMEAEQIRPRTNHVISKSFQSRVHLLSLVLTEFGLVLLLGIFNDLLIDPDFLLRLYSIYDVLDGKGFPTAGFHILIADPSSSCLGLPILSDRLVLVQFEVRVVEEPFLTGALASFPLLAPLNEPGVGRIIDVDHPHPIEVDPVIGIDKEAHRLSASHFPLMEFLFENN